MTLGLHLVVGLETDMKGLSEDASFRKRNHPKPDDFEVIVCADHFVIRPKRASGAPSGTPETATGVKVDSSKKKPTPAAAGTAIAVLGSTMVAPQNSPENLHRPDSPEPHFHYPEEWWSDVQE